MTCQLVRKQLELMSLHASLRLFANICYYSVTGMFRLEAWREYNFAECMALSKCMERVRLSMQDLYSSVR